MVTYMSRSVIKLSNLLFSVIFIFFLCIFSGDSNAEYNFYGCSCNATNIGSQGSCGSGQGCNKASDEIAGLYCFANPVGGFPLQSCGEVCSCSNDTDCSNISFAGKCIKGHCYAPDNGISVVPLACPQQSARQ